jgi:ribose 5-phosphate isomerase A
MQIPGEILDLIEDRSIVGLGTGRAATAFICALSDRTSSGLRISAVPTSDESARLASSLGIPLVSLDETNLIDVTIDGADEVDRSLNLIKGYGGALVREKIVASASKRFIVLVGPEKLVDRLGARGRLPVEILGFATGFCRRRFADFGITADIRMNGELPFLTDNGNLILDCRVSEIEDVAGLEQKLRSVPGVVGTGLFLGMADKVFVLDNSGFRLLNRPSIESIST